MASPFYPEQYVPFFDVGWSTLPEILHYGDDEEEDPWDSDADKILAEVVEPKNLYTIVLATAPSR